MTSALGSKRGGSSLSSVTHTRSPGYDRNKTGSAALKNEKQFIERKKNTKTKIKSAGPYSTYGNNDDDTDNDNDNK